MSMSDANNDFVVDVEGSGDINDAGVGNVVSMVAIEDVDSVQGTGNGSEDNVDGLEEKGVKRKREIKCRSEVWQHFRKLPVQKEGDKIVCQCIHCKRMFKLASSGGTSSMLRHINQGICTVYRKSIGVKYGQGTLSFNKGAGSSEEGSSLVVWKFDQERSRADLVEFIINKELPFSLADDKSFRKFVWGLNNKFKIVTRNTIKSDMLKLYESEKANLRDVFKKSKNAICLTSDTWTSRNNLPFMALTAHFISDDWQLHKKIINFVLVPFKATGENMCDLITNCLVDWNIQRICSITLDNASANDVVVRCIIQSDIFRGMLVGDGKFLHVRCWCHVINLIVQDGLDEIKGSIQRVRDAVKYVKASSKRKLEFLQYADQERVTRGKMLVLDVSTRWNSTYLMLASALHFRKACDRMKSRDRNFSDPPTPLDWKKSKIVHDFLETFYEVTNLFSGSKFCTAHLFFKEASRILVLLRKHSNEDSLLGEMATTMLKKFEKYWVEKEPNLLFAIALLLDPRLKSVYLKFILNKIYVNSEAEKEVCRVVTEFRFLFGEYQIEYERSLRDQGEGVDGVSGSSSLSQKSDAIDLESEFLSFKEETEKHETKSEFDNYMEEKCHPFQPDVQFDILSFWKVNSVKYPVLSRMARDILAIPVSSVASESAFSIGGRVLSPFRSSLLPSTVEALICTQDWIKGDDDRHESHEEYDEEFDAAFANVKI